jgi:hypothetical protein
VRIVIGSASKPSTGRIVALMSPRITPALSAAIASTITTPGTIAAAITIATPFRSRRSRNRI